MPPKPHRPSLVVWLAAAGLTLTTGIPALAAGFPDVPTDHWAHQAVNALSGERPLLEPLGDGLFHGADPFTRVQFAHTMRRLIAEIEDLAKTSIASEPTGAYHFKDVAAGDPDRALLIRLADQYRLYDGVPHLDRDYFGANEVVSRYEMAVVVDNLMRQAEAKDAVRVRATDRPGEFPFTDVARTDWARPIVDSVWGRYGVMVGFPDRTFRGREELTRYQFAAVAAQSVPLIRALVTRTAQEKHPTPAPVAAKPHDAPYRADILVGLLPNPSVGLGLTGRQDLGHWFVGERVRWVPVGLVGGAGGEVDVSGGYDWNPFPALHVRPSIGVGAWLSVVQLLTVGLGLDATWAIAPTWDLRLGVDGRQSLLHSMGSPLVFLPTLSAGFDYWPSDQIAVTFGAAVWTLPTTTFGDATPMIGPRVGLAGRF